MPELEWETPEFEISRFSELDSGLVKEIFESNQSLRSLDPTFGIYPDSEYLDLILRDQAPDETFCLRKIDSPKGETVGYFQLELHTPEPGVVWIPMLVLKPEIRGRGLGHRVMRSLFAELCSLGDFNFVRLNVYAENLRAFRFWYQQGFSKILGWEAEQIDGDDYQCLILEKRL